MQNVQNVQLLIDAMISTIDAVEDSGIEVTKGDCLDAITHLLGALLGDLADWVREREGQERANDVLKAALDQAQVYAREVALSPMPTKPKLLN